MTLISLAKSYIPQDVQRNITSLIRDKKTVYANAYTVFSLQEIATAKII